MSGSWVVTAMVGGKFTIEHREAGHRDVVVARDVVDRATADELVRRWNAHEDLLEALQGIVEVGPDGRPMATVTTLTLNAAVAAIAKAGGEHHRPKTAGEFLERIKERRDRGGK